MAGKWRTGIFKGRAVPKVDERGEPQLQYEIGESGPNKTPTIGIVMNVAQGGGQSRRGVVYLSLTDDSVEYTFQRLRALGWQGSNLSDLTGIDRNYVDVDVFYERFDSKDRLKLEIALAPKPRMDRSLPPNRMQELKHKYEGIARAMPEVSTPPPKGARGSSESPDLEVRDLDNEEAAEFADLAEDAPPS